MKRVLLCVIVVAGMAAGCGSDSADEPTADNSSAAGQSARDAASGSDGQASDAGGSDTEAAETTPAKAEPAARRRRGPLVKLRNSQLGRVLFSGGDRALYLFTRDRKNTTRCYGDCAQAWPPFYAKARPRAARGVDGSLLGTIRRRNGRRQVTYKGQPLYFYIHDPRGKVLCNDIVEFGGTWFAVDAEGNPPS